MWKRIKIYPYSPVVFRCNPEKWQSKRTDLDKTNMEKRVDKVLLGKIFILISFKERAFTHVNSQQMWMNFDMFSSSSCEDCEIQINFNLNAVDKAWKLLYYKRHQSE